MNPPTSRRAAPPAPPGLADRSLEIETPEHVGVGYELAGPGSRFSAFLIDGVILVVLQIALLMGLILTATAIGRSGLSIPGLTGPVIIAIWFVLVFCLFWGYFIWFETRRDGRTPGKKRLGLRVVQEGGFPITVREAVIRNLVRVIDIQPMPASLLGGGMILLHPRAQRLGDLAAGTVVIRERAGRVLPEEVDADGPPRLDPREYELLRSYLLRRDELEGDARSRLTARLARHFARHLGEQDGSADVDARLARLYAEESGRRLTTGTSVGSGSAAAARLFRQQRDRWREYEGFLERARSHGLASLPEDEVSRFAALYREAATDLARLRTYGASPELLRTLEQSVGTGHNLLYSAPRRSAQSAWRWLSAGFPSLVRQRGWAILAAAFLLFGPGLVTYGIVAADPGVARMVLPAEMIARAEEAAERATAGQGYVEIPEVLMPMFSSRIITNNVQVSFFAFAGGIFAGVGTVLLLLFNGVHLGGAMGLFRAEGMELYLWSFVAPHGVIELTAICIAGGAGLWMGSAFVLPGRLTRREALVIRAREAVSLLAGTVVLLLMAGLVEGFVSPSALPDALKLGFGILTAPVLFAYLLLGGREITAARDADHSSPRRLTSM